MINFLKFHMQGCNVKYGTDKPDLRNPLLINDITEILLEKMYRLKYLKNL